MTRCRRNILLAAGCFFVQYTTPGVLLPGTAFQGGSRAEIAQYADVVPDILGLVAVFLPGCDGGGQHLLFSHGQAEGAVSTLRSHLAVIAFRRKGGAESVHSQLDGHFAVAGVQQDRGIHPILLKQV